MFFLSSYAHAQSNQTFDFYIDSLSIDKAIASISKQSDIPIIFSSNALPKGKTIFFDASSTIEQALDYCLADCDIDFKWRNGKYILSSRAKVIRINGYIVDDENGERLIGVHIIDHNGLVSVTNEYGFFSLEIPRNLEALRCSYIGYQSKSVPVASIQNGFSISLERDAELPTLVVKGSSETSKENEFIITEEDGIKLDNILNTQIGSIGGEKDVVQKMQLLTGVQAFPDALGGWHIRGGGTEQNQILVDGAQIYNPSHALGILSIFNSDAIRYKKLYKGNMPAEYGGFSSSTLELYTKEGNVNHFGGKLSIGLVSAKLQFEGPLLKDKISFFISARKSIIDPLVHKISSRIKERNGAEGESNYSMYDVNAKLNFTLNNNHRLYVSFYKGGDKMQDVTTIEYRDLLSTYNDMDDGDYRWGNTVASFRWNHIISDKSFGNLTATYSEFEYKNEVYNLDEAILFDNTVQAGYYTLLNTNIKDASIRWDVDILQNKTHRFKTGFQLTYRYFLPGVFTKEFDFDEFSQGMQIDNLIGNVQDDNSAKPLSSVELAAYFRDNIRLGEIGNLELGLRLNYLFTQGKSYINPEPRIKLNLFSKNHNWHWNASFTKNTQFSHLLSPSEGGLPSDLWVPVTKNIKPQHAWLAVTGFKYLNSNAINLNVEGYYKRLYNQLLYDPNAFLGLNRAIQDTKIDWESEVLVGKGWSAGAEISMERVTKKYRAYVGYTLAWSKRQFDELNNGAYFPYRFDRRHDLALSLSYNLHQKVSFYASWFFGSGYPISLSRNRFSLLSPSANSIDEYNNSEPVNNFRLKHYHRMDIGLNINWEKPKVKHELHLGVYNVYNRKNPISAYLQVDPLRPAETNVKEISLLALLPSFSYSLSFGKKKEKQENVK